MSTRIECDACAGEGTSKGGLCRVCKGDGVLDVEDPTDMLGPVARHLSRLLEARGAHVAARCVGIGDAFLEPWTRAPAVIGDLLRSLPPSEARVALLLIDELRKFGEARAATALAVWRRGLVDLAIAILEAP